MGDNKEVELLMDSILDDLTDVDSRIEGQITGDIELEKYKGFDSLDEGYTVMVTGIGKGIIVHDALPLLAETEDELPEGREFNDDLRKLAVSMATKWKLNKTGFHVEKLTVH